MINLQTFNPCSSYTIFCFLLAVFKIFFISLFSSSFNKIYLSMVFDFILFEVCWASYLCKFLLFIKIWMVLLVISLNFLLFFFYSSGLSIAYMLNIFILSHRFLLFYFLTFSLFMNKWFSLICLKVHFFKFTNSFVISVLLFNTVSNLIPYFKYYNFH